MQDVGPLQPPPPLRPGDAISLIAPASAPDPDAYATGIQELEAFGYQPRVYRQIDGGDGYLAGSDDDRAAELNEALADPATRGVLAIRGGYGVMRILDRVDFGLLRRRPKVVCGYSDITALHSAIARQCGLVSFHGPNLIGGVGDASNEAADERAAFRATAAGERRIGDLLCETDCRAIRGGVARGRLVGGNLAILAALLGTPWMPATEGAILLMEDIGEAPYRVDRLLTQLRLAGVLDRVAGVACGYFTNCRDDEGPTTDALLSEFLEPIGVPVAIGLPAGHEQPNLPLPLGAEVELDADAGRLTLRSAAVAE